MRLTPFRGAFTQGAAAGAWAADAAPLLLRFRRLPGAGETGAERPLRCRGTAWRAGACLRTAALRVNSANEPTGSPGGLQVPRFRTPTLPKVRTRTHSPQWGTGPPPRSRASGGRPGCVWSRHKPREPRGLIPGRFGERPGGRPARTGAWTDPGGRERCEQRRRCEAC